MLIEEKEMGDRMVVALLEQRLDAAMAVDFKEHLSKLIQSGRNAIVLDFSAVQFIDSSGLGSLVGVLKMMGSGGDLRVCGVQSSVMGVFKLTRMDRVFSMYESTQDALAA